MYRPPPSRSFCGLSSGFALRMAVSVSATAPPLAVTVGAVAPLPSKLPPRLPGFKRTRTDSYGPQIQKTPGVQGFGWTASEDARSEEHTSELQSLMRTSYHVF